MHFQKDPYMYYLPHSTAELFIRHSWILFAVAPKASHFIRLDKFENAILSALPTDHARISGRVKEEITDELPQLARALTCNDQETNQETAQCFSHLRLRKIISHTDNWWKNSAEYYSIVYKYVWFFPNEMCKEWCAWEF